MAKKTSKPKKYLTPVGVAKWAHLNKPDDFKGKSKYKVDLALAGEEATELSALLDQLVEDAWEVKTADLTPAKIKKLDKHVPYFPEEDDDGEETGRTIFRFSQNAEIQGKPVAIGLFDAKGKPMQATIYGGSEMRVSYTVRPYLMESTKKVGISLDLGGVQVIDLVTGGGPRSADAYGFGEEEGYSAEDEEAPIDDATSDDSDDEAEPDF